MDERLKQILHLGREHYQKGEYDRAEEHLTQVVAQLDRFADVHNMLGVIAHRRSDLRAAEEHFERATELNPNYTEALLNLAVTYNDLGKYEAARDIYTRIRARPSGSDVHLDPFARGKIANMHADLAQAYVDAGFPHEAVEQYHKALVLCPSFADIRTRLGALFRDLGDLGRARAQYEAARDANPRYVPARVALGVTLLSMGEPEAAAREWRAALEVDPENRTAQAYLRMVEAQRGGGTPAP